MAVIDPIYNGEGGASVRAKLNQLIDTVNSGSTTINVGDAPIFDPDKAGGYEAGSIISYKNEASPDPEFQEFAIYLALYDIPQGVSPEDSPNWKNEGATMEVAGGNTANGVVQNVDRLRELTGMRTGHSVTVQEGGHVYVFNEGSEAGVKPFAPGIGSWELKYTKSVVEWQPGTYRSSPTLVLRNNAIYRLTRPVPFESTDFEAEASAPTPVWEKVSGGGGGHTFEDSTGTALPARSVAKAGAGIEFEDDAVGEMTVVRVDVSVTQPVISIPTSWDGTLHNIDLSSNAYQTLTVNNGVTVVAIGVTFPEDANEKMYEKVILIDNSNNNSAIASIVFDDNSGAYSWEWSVGDPINGIPANGKAEIHLYNRSATVIKALTDVEA